MNKKELRAQIKAKKSALTEQQIVDCSSRLAQQLFRHPAYQAAKSIYGYLSFNEEVRTVPILRQAQLDGKRVAVPKVFGDTMRFLWLDDLDAVAPGYYGVPEPVADGPEADDETALILMPGLAFDPEGRRCGYGGGFYDRYLAEHPHHATLALCYDFQMFDHLETDSYDVPVQYVLSAPVGEVAKRSTGPLRSSARLSFWSAFWSISFCGSFSRRKKLKKASRSSIFRAVRPFSASY